ncbi:carbon-nitrogen hydrolase family protein [Aliikangiella marina]|uniref:Carbon-nitrogen hydrolase family protein n=1 Tax=Aliikangiella marina TaxID=1712262 RepID=A0A545TDZ3_9GAMM|nr:carbon-nitrogen hydrolase family protein [Aliikangiella marina]TQV75386.1 carbon-nitrogen hydrolase family protein [Aliikangiella marina]
MENKRLKVACVQMVSGIDFQENLEVAARLIAQAKDRDAQLIVLPEFFALMGKNEKDKLAYIEPHGSGPFQDFLHEQTKKNKLWIVGGTHAIDSGVINKPFSRCYVYRPTGEVETWYDKIHLFDVAVDDNTKTYKESKYASPGASIKSFKIGAFHIGLAVCYDLRFPELFRQLTYSGCNTFVLPAAFTATTGKAHWEILLKARAIENQTYMLASAQAGNHQNGRKTWGHTCVVSPWGETLSEMSQGQGVIEYQLNLDELEKVRNEFPVLTHTRL